MSAHVPDLSRGVMPAELLPVSGFMVVPGKKGPHDHELQELIMRINAGSLAYLRVPSSLVYRWANLCGRWSPDLQTFIAQVLRHTGNLDNFLVQAAASDHHHGPHGLLEASLTAAELVLNPRHDPRSLQPLPPEIDDMEQVCSAAAFLFDIGKVFDPLPSDDGRRRGQSSLRPYSDLSRCWRSSWKALANRNPVLAAWMYHLGRGPAAKAVPVEVARSLTRNAVKASWRMSSSLHLV
ncbi:MAG TPA: hypothetical protein VF169_23810 [Albitalea sp.]|uniref:hypothetical protein n=1 Tax=Piscinibacter sp. TaxID=1903157 RepID=UPI002ED097B2